MQQHSVNLEDGTQRTVRQHVKWLALRSPSTRAQGATPVEMPCPATTFFGAPNTTCNTLDNVLGCTCTTVTAAANQTKELSILSAALAVSCPAVR